MLLINKCGAIVAFICLAIYAKKPMTIMQWEKCRDKVEQSISQSEVGLWGLEYEIKSKCGEPPTREPSALTGIIGMHPYDVVRSNAWKKIFQNLIKSKYAAFVERFDVAEGVVQDGDWIIGEGFVAHRFGSDEAAFAINSKSGEVFAIMREDEVRITKFGLNYEQRAPPFLQNWANANQ